MKNREIITIYDKLTALAKDNTLHLPAKVAYAIVHNLRTITPIAQDILEQKEKIGATYGKYVEDGTGGAYFHIPENKVEIANKELDDLLEMDTPFSPLQIKMESIENLELSIDAMQALYFMIGEG